MGCHLRIVFLGLYVGRLVFWRRNGVDFAGFAWVLHSVGGLLFVQKRIQLSGISESRLCASSIMSGGAQLTCDASVMRYCLEGTLTDYLHGFSCALSLCQTSC